MDEMAEKIGISANLCNTSCATYVKGEFSLNNMDDFMTFDADERQEIIGEIFEDQINF